MRFDGGVGAGRMIWLRKGLVGCETMESRRQRGYYIHVSEVASLLVDDAFRNIEVFGLDSWVVWNSAAEKQEENRKCRVHFRSRVHGPKKGGLEG